LGERQASGVRVAVERALCPLSRTGKASCRACQQVCPAGAVALSGGPKVDWSRCTGCGACAAVCPTGAVSLAPPLKLRPQGGKLVLGCPASHPEQGAVLPCLAALDATSLALVLQTGVQAVELHLGDCQRCVNGSAVAARHPFASWVQAVAQACGAGSVEVLEARTPHFVAAMRAALDRRALLRLPLPAGQSRPAVVWQEGAEVQGVPVGSVERVGECFLCPACVHACTAGALRIQGAKLEFFPERCNGCRACADACGFGALSVQPRSSRGVRTLAEGRPFACSRCGAEGFGTGTVCQRCRWQERACAVS